MKTTKLETGLSVDWILFTSTVNTSPAPSASPDVRIGV